MDKPHNAILNQAQRIKNDEFYTQYADIQNEMNAYLDFDPDVFRDKTVLLPCDDPEWSNFTKFFAQNFELFGLKKLISTSYAVESKQYKAGYQPSLFETQSPLFDSDKTRTNGKIFTLTRGEAERTDINALKWEYLDGDGDFRSPEVTALRDEANIIVTNPPFSLFREFLAWIIEGKKTFSIIGNQTCITYKEVYPLIKDDKIWLGKGFNGGNAYFYSPFSQNYGHEVKNDKNVTAFRTVLCALPAITRTRRKYGSCPKWTPTTSRRGATAARPIFPTVKCFALPIIAQKETADKKSRRFLRLFRYGL